MRGLVVLTFLAATAGRLFAGQYVLTQQSPHPGAATPFVTTLSVSTDANTIHFDFDCRDPDPNAIAIHTMQRDGDMGGDDSVAIVLDTFGDRRTGYLFRVNAAGARADGLVSGQDRDNDVSLDWDGVWDVRVERDARGWRANLIIPANTLRFRADLRAWNFNAERYVARERLTMRWSGTTLDSSFTDLRRAGALEGVESLRQGLGLTTNVNVVTRRDVDFGLRRRTLVGRPGVDVGYNITPQMGGVVTVNTDFAETEVDTRQINLTRFPLFFPEKRSFFLEGSNQFAFGLDFRNEFIPFYSRRIGLYQHEVVPLHAGLKVLGRSGRWGIAALDVQTGTVAGAGATNLFASRITYEVDQHLRVGTLLTNGNPNDVHQNRFGGLDATWSTSTFQGDKNLTLGAWTARSAGDVGKGNRAGWGFALDYPNDLWNFDASIHQFGDALDPALGFLPRPGTRKSMLNGRYQPRPEDSWIRQFFYELLLRRYEDMNGDPESWRIFVAPLNVESHSGVHLECNYVPQFERLDQPFEVSEGVFIPPGRYQFTRFRVEGQSSPSRPIRVGSTIWFGGFFNGRLLETEGFVTWSEPRGRLRLELEARNNFGSLPDAKFAQRLLQLRAIAAFTPNLIVSSFAQYDTDSREVGVNNRMRWTIRPEADLFVVWNHNWRHTLGEGAFNLQPRSDQFVVKLRWILRR